MAAATVAITGGWENTGIEKNETCLESGSNYWFWGAKLKEGVFHATLFMDPELSRIPGGDGLVRLYKYYLGKAQLFKKCLRGRLKEIFWQMMSLHSTMKSPSVLIILKWVNQVQGLIPFHHRVYKVR